MSPVTTKRSFSHAPLRFTISLGFIYQIAVTEIVNPLEEEVVSPPITSTP